MHELILVSHNIHNHTPLKKKKMKHMGSLCFLNNPNYFSSLFDEIDGGALRITLLLIYCP